MFSWEALTTFHFLRPAALLLLPVTGLLLVWYGRRKAAGNQWRNLIAPHLYKALVKTDRTTAMFNPFTFVCALAVLVCIVLAGPSWERQPSPFAQDLAALVIVLDVSSSMQQNDIQPNRLERAKQKVQDVLALRPGGRTGLIVYSGSAHIVVPLTDDRDVLENFLGAVDFAIMPRPGKLPGRALSLVDSMLLQSALPGTVLLLTDGIAEASVAQYEAYFSASQHQLLVLGIGGTPAKEGGTGTTANPSAATRYLPLQENSLKTLARAANGSYHRVSHDNSDVVSLQRRISHHLKLMQSQEGTVPWKDAGYYLVWLVAALFLPWFRSGWTLKFGFAVCLLTSFFRPVEVYADGVLADIFLTADQHGRWHFEDGDYELAAQAFSDNRWKGVAFYFCENFDAAAATFSQNDTAEGQFLLANALAHARRYVEAVGAYREALRKQPEHAGAQKNLLIVQGIIDENDRLSDSQRAEPGQYSKELGDGPQSSQGAERRALESTEQETLSANQILTSEVINALWMREVQPNPSVFMATKFHMQLQAQEDAADAIPR